MAPKKVKSFRFSRLTIERLRMLAEDAELTETTYLEQLIKREAELLEKKDSR